MEALFLKLVNMSITASYLVAAVLVLRFLLKKAPKAIHCGLWGLVAVRLLFPFSPESIFSLIPSTQPLPKEFLYAATPQLNTGIPTVDQSLNPVIAQSLTPAPLTSANPTQINSFIFSQLWILGMVVMLLYAVISYCLVQRRVRVSIALDKTVHLCDQINTPFILGIVRPKIYLPSDLDPMTAGHVLAHEQAHLKRHDHWWKPLGFALLSVYWFNPVLWLAYILLCRDIEQACDEKVIQNLDTAGKKAYSQALFACSVPRRMITACPLAFGEVGVKNRIKSVLHYKKPAFWIIAVAVIACIAVAICFLTDPKKEGPSAHEVTSDLWIYDSKAVDVTVWDEDGSHKVHLTKPQIEKLSEIIHDLNEEEFLRKKTSEQILVAELDCEDFDIILQWDGEYACFSFDAATEERITGNRRSVKNDILNTFLAEIAQTEYRLQKGTYVPIEAASLYGEAPDILSLIENSRFEVTGSALTVSDLGTGAVAAYDVDWSWKDYREAIKQLGSTFGHVNYHDSFINLHIKLDDTELKYQQLDDHCHIIFQDDTLYWLDGTDIFEDGRINWTIYQLTAYTPYLIPPATYEEFFENVSGYCNYTLALVRSGDRRPGLFFLTEEEINNLSTILAQMPAEAVQPGGLIPDYYVTLSVCATVNAELFCEAYFWYYGGEVGMYWLSHASSETKLYRIDYAPLAEFLAGLMQPERIETYGVNVDLRGTLYSEGLYQYITYTHADISFDLVKIVGWDYEIVPYADDQTAFGIRCKPEWLDDWLFFGYMPSKLTPESTSLYERRVECSRLGDEWHYLFENPISGEIWWREWPELWKMIYCHADGGTYFIYNEGSFDERLSEHDRGGYMYIEKSFAFGLLSQEVIIEQSRYRIYLPDYDKAEVTYDADTSSYLVTWHKKDSDGYTVVRVNSVQSTIVEEVAGAKTE